MPEAPLLFTYKEVIDTVAQYLEPVTVDTILDDLKPDPMEESARRNAEDVILQHLEVGRTLGKVHCINDVEYYVIPDREEDEDSYATDSSSSDIYEESDDTDYSDLNEEGEEEESELDSDTDEEDGLDDQEEGHVINRNSESKSDGKSDGVSDSDNSSDIGSDSDGIW